jgi:hypothetical protein
VEKRIFLTLPGLELRPLGRPASSQSLYQLHYPGSHQERVEAKMDAGQEGMKAWRKETTACQEATEAYPERTEQMASVATHLEDSNIATREEALGTTDDRSGDRHLAVRRRRQPKERTEGDGGSRQKFAAAPAPRKGHCRQGPGRDNVVRGTPKGRNFEMRHRAQPKRNSGIRDRVLRREPRLGSKEALGQIIGLEVAERAVEFFHRAMGSELLDIVKGSAPSETKEETSKAQPSERNKDDDGGKPGPACTLSGSRSGRVTLRREQREQLESNRSENRATGKEGEADHKRHKHSPRKRRNGGMPVGHSERIALRREQCRIFAHTKNCGTTETAIAR